jgi:Ca-activated chloride channel homolog
MNRTPKLKRVRICSLLPVALVFCSFARHSERSSFPALAARDQAKIAVKTELVVLPVGVTDGKGNFVPGLTLQNFRVYQDGLPQEITKFQMQDTPVSVGLIVDHSRSMGPNLAKVASAVSAFARSSNDQDEMFVVDFNDDVSVELLGGKPFTNNASELEKAVSAVRARGRTALYDAVAEGILHLKLGSWEKKALIVVSDGDDNASQQKFSQILEMAHRSQVAIYSIALVEDDDDGEEHPNVLRRLSKDTGGIAFFPKSLEGVADISKTIARDLREQYTLGFIPDSADATNTFREIKVKVTAPGHSGLRVRTRPGYVRNAVDTPPPKPPKRAL